MTGKPVPLWGFRVQIPTPANAKTDDKRRFENPGKMDRLASRKQMRGCDFEAPVIALVEHWV